MDLHPNVAPLAALVGTWQGTGRGEYPTIAPFDYADEWVFSHSGKPFLGFVERTRSPQGAPMHTESGYLRGVGGDDLEIVAALPTGQSELGTGRATTDGDALVVSTDAEVRNTPRAKQVDRITRTFRVDGDVLTVEMAMTAVGVGLTRHLTARLERVTDR